MVLAWKEPGKAATKTHYIENGQFLCGAKMPKTSLDAADDFGKGMCSVCETKAHAREVQKRLKDS